MRKISGLLAKAEGTDNEHESKVFFEKAYELMTKHAVDEARLRQARKSAANGRIEEPVVEDYMFASYAHHAEAKAVLFEMVCKAHSVRAFLYENRKYYNRDRVAAAGLTGLHESQWCKLVGYKDDIEMVKMLYLSLLLQSNRFANEDWRVRYGHAKVSDWDDGMVGKFSWMSSHMEGFAYRIGERFKELAEAIYSSTLDGTELIRNKDADIQEWMYEHGIMRRPTPPSEWRTCWTAEPESNRPLTKAGTPNKKWRAKYCMKQVSNLTELHQDEGSHTFTYDPGPDRYSYYVSKGSRRSYQAGNIGRSSADRADIGLSRVGNTSNRLTGG
jgi:hypothetical protein